MKLQSLRRSLGVRDAAPRKGRGNASKGSFSGRGVKGQKARKSGRVPFWFEGGQSNIFMRLPKLGGFRNINRVAYQPINLVDLDKHFAEGDTVTMEALIVKGLVRANMPAKLLGNGAISKKLTIQLPAASASAQKAIEKAGGTVTTTPAAAEAAAEAPKAKAAAKKPAAKKASK